MSRRIHKVLLSAAISIRRRQTPPHPGAGYRNFPCLPLPEEPTPDTAEDAPWDDSAAMSYEELAELIGL
jgi:hypothetical protein